VLEFDVREFKTKPRAHQHASLQHLLKNPAAALFDEMGVGKSKPVVDAADVLFKNGLIDAVVVVCPAAVRGVWDDDEFGQITTHSWQPHAVHRFDSYHLTLGAPPPAGHLLWVVTSYDLLRTRLKELLKLLRGRRFFLVLDESSRIKSRVAQQTKRVLKLRREATRCVILNGTPISNNLMDLWSQFNVLDSKAIYDLNYYAFRATYAIMGGWEMRQVVGYHEAEVRKLTAHLQKWVLRRTKDECLDLPEKVYTFLEVALQPESFRLYREMREEMVAWLGDQNSIASHGAIKVLRLAQICAGYLGGVDPEGPAREVGREKLDLLLKWQLDHPENLIVWCRFREELKRVARELAAAGRAVVTVIGGQSDKARQEGINLFQQTPGAVLVGQPQAGGWGLNLTAARTVVYMSNDYNLVTRLQSEDRAHRIGQKEKVTYVDFLATTPSGHRTADHIIHKALLKKEELAAWTLQDWREALGKD
jgi:SNF2 family DNA or RNA helicase